jgi:hypothetical protein
MARFLRTQLLREKYEGANYFDIGIAARVSAPALGLRSAKGQWDGSIHGREFAIRQCKFKRYSHRRERQKQAHKENAKSSKESTKSPGGGRSRKSGLAGKSPHPPDEIVSEDSLGYHEGPTGMPHDNFS